MWTSGRRYKYNTLAPTLEIAFDDINSEKIKRKKPLTATMEYYGHWAYFVALISVQHISVVDLTTSNARHAAHRHNVYLRKWSFNLSSRNLFWVGMHIAEQARVRTINRKQQEDYKILHKTYVSIGIIPHALV